MCNFHVFLQFFISIFMHLHVYLFQSFIIWTLISLGLNKIVKKQQAIYMENFNKWWINRK